MKYQGHTIAAQEAPGEISLVLLIAGCGRSCPGCHSPELQADEGRPLATELLDLLHRYKGLASCVCFMGEGGDTDALIASLRLCRAFGYKTCLYSGADSVKEVAPYLQCLDYLKIGRFDRDLGGLNCPQTNQRFYKRINMGWDDITGLFQKRRD